MLSQLESHCLFSQLPEKALAPYHSMLIALLGCQSDTNPDKPESPRYFKCCLEPEGFPRKNKRSSPSNNDDKAQSLEIKNEHFYLGFLIFHVIWVGLIWVHLFAVTPGGRLCIEVYLWIHLSLNADVYLVSGRRCEEMISVCCRWYTLIH